MVCEMIQDNTKERYPDKNQPKKANLRQNQGLNIPAKKTRTMAGTAAKVKDTTKTKKCRKLQRDFKLPAVPGYAFKNEKHYDVYDSYKSLKDAEYVGHEVIGHLILYRFMQGAQLYKFSEFALKMHGKAVESESRAEVKYGGGAV